MEWWSHLRKFAFATLVPALAVWSMVLSGQQAERVAIDPDDIGGVVTSSKGPEAGVWVIAETTDLPTKFARIVVTDDRGRYVVPDLPRATYQVFVRGYGLVDSPRADREAGAAAESDRDGRPRRAGRRRRCIRPPGGFRCSRPPAGLEAQKKFTMDVKECYDCHQLGTRRRANPAGMSAGTARRSRHGINGRRSARRDRRWAASS